MITAATPDRSLLPASLRTLILLRYKAALRRRFSLNPKRLVFSLVGLLLIVLYLLPNLLASRGSDAAVEAVREGFRLWTPMILLGMCLSLLTFRSDKPAVIFSPAEIDLVIPGPYLRRQLILYQLAFRIGPMVLGGLWMALLARQSRGNYFLAALAVTLAFQLIQLLAMNVAALRRILGVRARWWWIIPTAVVAAVGVAAFRYAADHPIRTFSDIMPLVHEVRSSTAAHVILAPFTPLAELFTTTRFDTAAGLIAVTLGINLFLTALLIRLDRGEIEALVLHSQKRHAAVTGRPRLAAAAAKGRTVPMLPRLGGTGPVLWRQLVQLYRGGGPLLAPGLPLFLAVGGAFAGRIMPNPLIALLPAAAFSSLMLSMLVRCDFRNDYDYLAHFKTLPIPTRALVVGQIAAPVLCIALVQAAFFAGLAAGSGSAPVALLALGLVALFIPASAAWICADNLVFLMAPTRPLAQRAQRGLDPAETGRQFLLALLKLLIAAAVAAVAGGPAWLLHSMGAPLPVVISAAAILLLACIAALVVLVTYAFDKFDPAADQPA